MPVVGQGVPSVDSGADGLAVRTSGGGLRPPTLSSVEPRGMPTRPTTDDPIPVGEEADAAGPPAEPLVVAAHVPDAVPPRPPPSKIVLEPDVPGFAIPIEPPRAPASEHAVAPPIAGTTGDAPDVIGLTPGDASSVAPSGIPVGATGAAGPMPSGDVMPSGDGPGDVASPPICADAGPQPNNAVVIATINRRVMIGLLLVSDRSSTKLRSHPSRHELTRIAATCSRLRRWPSAAAASDRGSGPHARLRRKAVGVSPVALRKAAVNELVSLKPIANPTSVTEDMGLANSVLASSIRRSL